MRIKYYAIVSNYGYGDITVRGNFKYKRAADRALRQILADDPYLADRTSVTVRFLTLDTTKG
jgi:uncharacterized protein YutD